MRPFPRLSGCLLTIVVLIAGIGCSGSYESPSPTAPTPSSTPAPFISVAGTLWATCRVNATGPDFYSDPMPGVTVSTSLDAQTTTTDAAGRFSLVTQTRPAMGQDSSYTLSFNGSGVSFSVAITGTAIEGRNFSPNQCPVF
jgi:hypothetical protein